MVAYPASRFFRLYVFWEDLDVSYQENHRPPSGFLNEIKVKKRLWAIFFPWSLASGTCIWRTNKHPIQRALFVTCFIQSSFSRRENRRKRNLLLPLTFFTVIVFCIRFSYFRCHHTKITSRNALTFDDLRKLSSSVSSK